MNNHLTDLTLVVDRSGSMEAIREDAEGGVNAFLRQQAEQPDEALVTLVQFDTEYELLERGTPVGQVQPYQLVPRGHTALLDAVGRAINETGSRLSSMPEADRPGLVVFVIVTDGAENSSCEFTLEQVRKMIDEQTRKYNWKFTFLGANPDAFAEAEKMGIDTRGAAMFAADKVALAYAMTSKKLSRMRREAKAGTAVNNSYTEGERDAMR